MTQNEQTGKWSITGQLDTGGGTAPGRTTEEGPTDRRAASRSSSPSARLPSTGSDLPGLGTWRLVQLRKAQADDQTRSDGHTGAYVQMYPSREPCSDRWFGGHDTSPKERQAIRRVGRRIRLAVPRALKALDPATHET
jgi:hypothetical protein